MPDSKKKICLDFDGCVHLYSRGWQDGQIYDDVVSGFFDWAEQAQHSFELVIYSSRSATAEGRAAMIQWVMARMAEWAGPDDVPTPVPPIVFTFASEKPPAWLTIDDRCVRFDGQWSDPQLTPAAMLAFKPWNSPRYQRN